EVGDAIGVEGADDRIEPIEAALLGLSSCVTEAIVLNCARTGVKLDGLDVKAHADVDPGPITGAKESSDWDNTLKQITVDVTAHGDFSGDDRKMIEDGAKRSPVRYMFSKTGLLKTNLHYESKRGEGAPSCRPARRGVPPRTGKSLGDRTATAN